MCGADSMLLCRRRQGELRRDVELDKEREPEKTGGLVRKAEMRRESCYIYQNPISPPMEAHGRSERDLVSRIRFSRPTSRVSSNQ
jgi:hypothetical protein